MIRWRWVAAVTLGAILGVGFALAAGEMGETIWRHDRCLEMIYLWTPRGIRTPCVRWTP